MHAEPRAAIDNLLYANDSGAGPQVRIKERSGRGREEGKGGQEKETAISLELCRPQTASAWETASDIRPAQKVEAESRADSPRPVRTCARRSRCCCVRAVSDCHKERTSPAGPQMCAVIAGRRSLLRPVSLAKNNCSLNFTRAHRARRCCSCLDLSLMRIWPHCWAIERVASLSNSLVSWSYPRQSSSGIRRRSPFSLLRWIFWYRLFIFVQAKRDLPRLGRFLCVLLFL